MTSSPPLVLDDPATADRRRSPLGRELAILAAVAACLFLMPYVVDDYALQVGYLILQLAALATAWNLLAGYTGLVSLGSAAFVGIGTYTMAMLDERAAPVWFAIIAAGVVAAVFAAVVSPAMFRLRGLYFTIGTLALAEALRMWMVNARTFNGAAGIYLTGRPPAFYQLYWLVLVAAIGATAVVVVILRRPLALRLNAVRDDEDVAAEMGVRVFRAKLVAFAVSGSLMGIIGAVQALNTRVVVPNGAFGLTWTVNIVLVALIGGLGTRTGPWIGAVFAILLQESLRGYPEIHLAITGAVLLLVIRFAPSGIGGAMADGRRRLARVWRTRS